MCTRDVRRYLLTRPLQYKQVMGEGIGPNDSKEQERTQYCDTGSSYGEYSGTMQLSESTDYDMRAASKECHKEVAEVSKDDPPANTTLSEHKLHGFNI